MSAVLLVAGNVPMDCLTAFRIKIRWHYHNDPQIALVPAQYDDLRSLAYEAMNHADAHEAGYSDKFVESAMRDTATKLLTRILPWGTTKDDIQYIVVGIGLKDDAFDWVLPIADGGIVYCFVREGEDGQPWMECPELGNFDASKPLGELRGDTVFPIARRPLPVH